MFSYRHAFHAGNHADVLKHTTLLAVLRHMVQKDTAIHCFDTHAGAGLYRLDGDYAKTSGEATQGFLHLPSSPDDTGARAERPLAPALQDYLDLVASFNPAGSNKVYPGSPFIIQRLLRERDRLRLFELHPTDAKTLRANVAQLEAGRLVTVMQEDGFEGLKKFLPPPSRRALVLCDPSYEMKTDYARVLDMMTDALKRFATGTYLVWYPIIPRPEAHELPRKLKTLVNREGRPWLNATLTVKTSKLERSDEGEVIRPGLPSSGMFVINPPHTLKAKLNEAIKQVAEFLAQSSHSTFTVESGGH
ncbi:MAG: 23S rRNA (adenine(2030)-N(6))-methyltransferase RlmJ [Rhodoferax sp.]|uniref:23S rRNA (adenine(2030)-N(6))-methyltransferase RlmJ n=1 Tax=Rhodoferax sp. TaxID=50421 RepID=UPI001B6FAD3B|nr:23S rRNA (adenine(2030)-N(6))-methyltransferase RlmJ [Rhodoferax sp.]MBP9905728.1 23S rRNA (adenine(2030)-N(6))-methyltransferase RlmJ [Rhodoferax sp.]